MRRKLKIMLVLSLFLLLIGCGKEKDDSQIVKESKVEESKIEESKVTESKVTESKVKEKKLSRNDALLKYLEEGILEEYTEPEILAELFKVTFTGIKEDSAPLRNTDYNYETLDKFMEEFELLPEYKDAIDFLINLGYNREESKVFFKSTIGISFLYNEYTDKGIDLIKEIDAIVEKDERIQNHLRALATVTKNLATRTKEGNNDSNAS